MDRSGTMAPGMPHVLLEIEHGQDGMASQRAESSRESSQVQGRLDRLLNGYNSSGGNSSKWEQCLTALHGCNFSFCGPVPSKDRNTLCQASHV